MSAFGQGNTSWVNLPATGGGGTITDANEGLTVIAGNVQLGVPAPDLTRAITVPREIQVQPGVGATLAICTTGGNFTGNVFFYDEANGIHIDGRQAGGGGQSTRYNFNYDGIQINASNSSNGIIFNQGFPVGTNRANINVNSNLDLFFDVNNGGVMFRTAGGTETWLGDIGYGYGLNIGYDVSSTSSAVIFSSATQPEMLAGMIDWMSPGLFSIYAVNSGVIDLPLQINPNTGYMGLAGGATSGGAAINIGANPSVAQFNFAANGVLTNDGDLDYDGSLLKIRLAGFNCNILASEFYMNPGQIPFGANNVPGGVTRSNGFWLDTTDNTLFVGGINTSGQRWEFGAYTNIPVVMDNNNYIEVIIAGVNYKLLVAV